MRSIIRVIRRIGIDIRRRKESWVAKILIFTLLFSLFFTSVLIESVSVQISDNLIKQFNITSGILTRDLVNSFNQTKKEYFNNTNKYLKVFNDLATSEGVDYQDINFSPELFFQLQLLDASKDVPEILYFISRQNSDHIEQCFQCLEGKNKFCIAPMLKSVRNPNFIDLNYQRLKLVEGRTFTQQELNEGAPVCIIQRGESLLSKDGELSSVLQVGDRIPVSELYYNKKGSLDSTNVQELTIIGIYEPTNGVNIITEQSDVIVPVYIPETLLKNMYNRVFDYYVQLNSNYLNTNAGTDTYRVYQGIYGFNTVDHLKIFLDDLENNELYFSNGYTYFSTVDQYFVSISNILSISQSFGFVSKICFLMCIFITMMILIFDILKRRNEIGLFLSMGSSIKEVLFQFVLELLFITLVSVGLALFLSSGITELGNQFLFRSSLDSLVQLTSSISAFELPGLLENFNQKSLVELMKPQYTKDNFLMFSFYTSVLLIIDGITCWIFIHKIEPIDLLKDE